MEALRFIIRLKKGRKIISPWTMAADLQEASPLVLAEAGELAELRSARDEFLGIGYYNRISAIAFRLLTPEKEKIDTAFFAARLERALRKRDAIDAPFYRLVHSEGDFLPGLVIDRFGDMCVLQVSTAGMERLLPFLLEALDAVIDPRAVLLRNDIPARAKEGLHQEVKLLRGEIPPLVEVHENGIRYLADLWHGQKTGWFYDQRENRALIASRAAGKTVLDVFSHSGGFGLPAAGAGASLVTMVDSSALALSLAEKAARLNGVESRCEMLKEDAFRALEGMSRKFDIVVADPPAFIRSRCDIAAGLKGYARVARLSASRVAAEGLLMVCSCSHHATRPRFREAVLQGVTEAGRKAEILAFTGHAVDHPAHSRLPQGEYLKALLLRIS